MSVLSVSNWSKWRAQAIRDKAAEERRHDGRHRAAADDQQVRRYSDDHGHAKQQAAKEAGNWDEEKNGTSKLDDARDVSEPLTDANEVKDLHHLPSASELCSPRSAEEQREENS